MGLHLSLLILEGTSSIVRSVGSSYVLFLMLWANRTTEHYIFFRSLGSGWPYQLGLLSNDIIASHAQELGAESEPKGEEVAKEELVAHSPVKSNASQDYFDRSQYETADEPYLKDREEFEYVSF